MINLFHQQCANNIKAIGYTFVILVLLAETGYTQSINNVNYAYTYNPAQSISFDINAIRFTDHWTVFYRLKVNDTTISKDDLSIQWEMRKNLDQKEGVLIPQEELGLTIINSEKQTELGRINFSISSISQVIVAKVMRKSTNKTGIFFKILEPNYPLIAYLTDEKDEVIFDPYIHTGKLVAVNGFPVKRLLSVSYYKEDFPVALPVFSEGQTKASKGFQPDSIFTISSSELISFKSKGLYLIQEDANAPEGISFRVEDDYPKIRKFQDLRDPFIYVSTKLEFDRLKQAGTDKRKFDKVVLDITKDVDRAKDFMRVYFRRAEAANQYFTSYKEGWKTDRGMVYMIYGPPNTVYRFPDREVWNYDKTNFNFMKSSTLFDPDNYVLVRNKKYTAQWFEKVDLVRNSRF